MLAILAILIAFTAWTHRDWAVLAPEVQPGTTRLAEPTSRRHLYFGPPGSVAILPFNCAREKLQTGEGAGDDEITESDEVPGPDPVLAFGIARTLADGLLQNDSLQVTSTVSSFFFADSRDSSLLLAERLRTRHILDGCMDRDNEQVGIALQLFDVRTGKYEWSETYRVAEAELPELIDQMLTALTEKLSPGSESAQRSKWVTDEASWMRLLQGQHLLRQPSAENLAEAAAVFTVISESNPDYAQAWLELGQVYAHPLAPHSDSLPALERSRQSAHEALNRDAELSGAYLLLSRINRFYDWDFAGSRSYAGLALEHGPGDADVLANASSNALMFQEFERAIEWLEESINRNPVVLNKLLKLGLINEFAGDYEQAFIVYRQLLKLNPDYPAAHAYKARLQLARGRLDEALEESELETHPFWRNYSQVLALDALGRNQESEPLLESMIEEHGHEAATQIAEILARRGDIDRAFGWLDRAFETRDGGLMEIRANPFFSSLHDDPRWSGLLIKLGLADE